MVIFPVIVPKMNGERIGKMLLPQMQIGYFQLSFPLSRTMTRSLLFLLIAVMTILYIWLGRVNLDGGDR